MDDETQRQLAHVLYAINNSRRLLILVVRHLQAEAYGKSSPDMPSSSRLSVTSSASSSTSTEGPITPTQKPQTLMDLMHQETGCKRRRSVTHFEGVPLAAIMPPPERAPSPGNRKVSTPRRLRGLEKAMRALSHNDHEMDNEGARGREQQDEHEDSSDDDDDLVIVM